MAVLLACFISQLDAETSAANEYAPVKVSFYKLHSSDTLTLKTVANGNIEVTFFNASVSDSLEIIPPLYVKSSKSTVPAVWAPRSKETGGDYILIISPSSKENSYPKILPIKADSTRIPQSSLLVANLNDQVLDCSYNGADFVSHPLTVTTLAKETDKLSFQAKGTKLSLYTNITMTEIEKNQRQLLILSSPHVKWSSTLSHRLVRISKELF